MCAVGYYMAWYWLEMSPAIWTLSTRWAYAKFVIRCSASTIPTKSTTMTTTAVFHRVFAFVFHVIDENWQYFSWHTIIIDLFCQVAKALRAKQQTDHIEHWIESKCAAEKTNNKAKNLHLALYLTSFCSFVGANTHAKKTNLHNSSVSTISIVVCLFVWELKMMRFLRSVPIKVSFGDDDGKYSGARLYDYCRCAHCITLRSLTDHRFRITPTNNHIDNFCHNFS